MPCGGRESRRSSSVRREVVRAQRPAAACLLLLRLLQGASSGASSAASDESSAAAVIFPVYVQPSGPVAEGRNKDNRRGPLGVDLSGALGSPCGSKEEPCSDIRRYGSSHVTKAAATFTQNIVLLCSSLAFYRWGLSTCYGSILYHINNIAHSARM